MDVLGEWPLSELAPIVRSAHNQGKPVVFIGTGTEKLFRDESKSIMRNDIAPSVSGWSVRCEKDMERLVEYGVPGDQITVAADLAWILDGVSVAYGKEYLSSLNVASGHGLVGVNINNESFIHEKAPHFFEKLAGFLDAIIEKFDYRILFLCNEVREDDMFDKFASQKVLGFMNYRDKAYFVPNNYWAPQDMLSMIGCCSFTIGTRYHFCLFSALQNIPFIAIKRSDKVDDLCWDMNWPYGLPLTELDVSNLLEMVLEVRQQAASLDGFLKERVELMKQRVVKNSIPMDILESRKE
jgi:polysaccharide pyruvyl transferase WcaK-like protein